MRKDVALVTIHGMGKVKPNYHVKLEDELTRKLDSDWNKIAFSNIQFAKILQDGQNDLWKRMTAKHDLHWDFIREFTINSLSDAATLEHSLRTEDKFEYIAVQKEIQRALYAALKDLDGDTSRPVVLIAHSLGGEVISNYIWDAQKKINVFENPEEKDPAILDFLKLKTLTNIITTGCNIPLFVAGMSKPTCFNRPEVTWNNYFDKDDVLGYPLQELGPTYEFIKDHMIRSGNPAVGSTPGVHGTYWTDNSVTTPLINILKSQMS